MVADRKLLDRIAHNPLHCFESIESTAAIAIRCSTAAIVIRCSASREALLPPEPDRIAAIAAIRRRSPVPLLLFAAIAATQRCLSPLRLTSIDILLLTLVNTLQFVFSGKL